MYWRKKNALNNWGLTVYISIKLFTFKIEQIANLVNLRLAPKGILGPQPDINVELETDQKSNNRIKSVINWITGPSCRTPLDQTAALCRTGRKGKKCRKRVPELRFCRFRLNAGFLIIRIFTVFWDYVLELQVVEVKFIIHDDTKH
jgi:hypothetical protein